jgi:pimeloyl-[acyl-carrier protein] methyl ester esterase
VIRHEVQFADGRTLAWRECGAGPLLVLLHGWSLSGVAFTELAGYLDGFRLLLPDLPGHGGSSPPPVASLPDLANDIAAWLAAIAPGPVLLGGWSLGGMIALELAARADSPVDRLLLLAATPRFTAAEDWPHGLPQGQIQALRRNLARRFESTLGDFFALCFADGEVDVLRLREIRAFAVRPGGHPDRTAAAALLDLLTEHDQRPLLAEIRCPTLVVHGMLDRVTPVGAGQALAAALPHGKLCGFAGLGHAPFWTRPAEVARVIREYCAWDR